MNPLPKNISQRPAQGAEHLKVLMYHRIVRERALSDRHWFCVHVDDFRRQLEFLDRWGFVAITFDDYRLFRQGLLDLPRKAVILTFDDGYLDTYHNAFPILKEFGKKAVVFVLGESKIRTNMWDGPAGLPEAPLMDSHEILELHLAGFEIGAHSMTHPKLTSISEKGAWEEISRSRMLLEILLNNEVRSFSYPYGLTNEKVKSLVESAGFDLACAGEGGAALFGADLLEVKRIKIGGTTGPFGFAMRILMPFEYLTSMYLRGKAIVSNGKNRKSECSTILVSKQTREPEALYADWNV